MRTHSPTTKSLAMRETNSSTQETLSVSPSDTIFMRVESDEHERFNIYWGDVVIIERNNLRHGRLRIIYNHLSTYMLA